MIKMRNLLCDERPVITATRAKARHSPPPLPAYPSARQLITVPGTAHATGKPA